MHLSYLVSGVLFVCKIKSMHLSFPYNFGRLKTRDVCGFTRIIFEVVPIMLYETLEIHFKKIKIK